jgi:hypothetical protein
MHRRASSRSRHLEGGWLQGCPKELAGEDGSNELRAFYGLVTTLLVVEDKGGFILCRTQTKATTPSGSSRAPIAEVLLNKVRVVAC